MAAGGICSGFGRAAVVAFDDVVEPARIVRVPDRECLADMVPQQLELTRLRDDQANPKRVRLGRQGGAQQGQDEARD